MAAQVPYNPALNVSPQQAPTPYRETQTPLAAFGGAVAGATEHLGQVEEGAGKELFDRAYAIQAVNQQAEATQASSNYMTKVGDIFSKYSTQEGQNAVQGYDPYVKQINDLREDMKGGLNSPLAQRAFDQDSRYMQSRAVWMGSEHAAQENKKFALGANRSMMDAMGNQAMATPDDDTGFEKSLENLPGLVNHNAQIDGYAGTVQESVELQNEQSKLYSQRIQGLSKTEPFRAKALLDKATQEGKVVGQEVGRLDGLVRNQMYNTGARYEASNIMAGAGGQFGAGKVSLPQAQDAIGGYETHNNYTLTGPTTKSGDQALGRYQIMGANLQPWLKEAGMSPMTPAQFLGNSKAQDQLFQFKFGQFMDNTGSFNDAAKIWFTGSSAPKPGVMDATATTRGHTVDQYLQGTNAILANNAPLSDLTTAGLNRAKQLAPDDPVLGDYITAHIETQFNRQKAIQKDAEFKNGQTIDQAFVNSIQATGKPPRSVDELIQNPEAKAAWEALPSDKQLSVIKSMGARKDTDDEGTLQTYRQLYGMSIVDPEKFMDQDMISSNLTTSEMKSLIDRQGQTYQKAAADPNMTHALSVLSPTMELANITKTDSPQQYYQFVGSLHDEVEQFSAQNGRPPKDDEIRGIGSRLMSAQQQFPSFFHPMGSSTSMYQVDVPKGAAEVIRSNPFWAKNGIQPSDDDIRRMYVNQMYQDQFGSKKAKP